MPTPCPAVPAFAASSFKDLDLTRNPLAFHVPSVASSDPATVRYFLEILLPDQPGSTTFVPVQKMESTAPPPVVSNGQSFFSGPDIYIHDVLNAYLKPQAPAFNQNAITVSEGHVLPYQLKHWSSQTPELITTTDLRYALAAGLNYEDFTQQNFFRGYLRQYRAFLTWQPVEKVIEPDQPEYLYFLLNFTSVPTQVTLKANVTFEDGDCEARTLLQKTDLNLMDVLCIPVGHNALGLGQLTRKVKSYVVWLENQAGERISEARSFTLETRYRRHKRYLLFQNSLGGYDTLRCYGAGGSVLSVNSETVSRFLPYNYQASDAEVFAAGITGEDELEVSTGYLKKEQELEYLQELFLSDAIYLVRAQSGSNTIHYLSVRTTTRSINYQEDDTYLHFVKVKLKKNHQVRNYSRIPAGVVVINDQPIWEFYGPSVRCEQDAPRTSSRRVAQMTDINQLSPTYEAFRDNGAYFVYDDNPTLCPLDTNVGPNATVLTQNVRQQNDGLGNPAIFYDLIVRIAESATIAVSVSITYTNTLGVTTNYTANIPAGQTEKLYTDVQEARGSTAYTVTHQVQPGDFYQVGTPSSVTVNVPAL